MRAESTWEHWPKCVLEETGERKQLRKGRKWRKEERRDGRKERGDEGEKAREEREEVKEREEERRKEGKRNRRIESREGKRRSKGEKKGNGEGRQKETMKKKTRKKNDGRKEIWLCINIRGLIYELSDNLAWEYTHHAIRGRRGRSWRETDHIFNYSRGTREPSKTNKTIKKRWLIESSKLRSGPLLGRP